MVKYIIYSDYNEKTYFKEMQDNSMVRLISYLKNELSNSYYSHQCYEMNFDGEPYVFTVSMIDEDHNEINIGRIEINAYESVEYFVKIEGKEYSHDT
jgi:hypothetical protein